VVVRPPLTERLFVYQTPITVATACDRIADRRLLLPAIQRELVWKPEQVCNLWDSLLRGYPIGSFLFWRIPESLRGSVRLYDFIADFDVRSPHNVEAKPSAGVEIIAVLDGQQRLSAFNIGLRGSYREKLPRKRWSNPDAFPERFLHLRLDEGYQGVSADEPEYDFRFLTKHDVEGRTAGNEVWFPVSESATMRPEGLEWIDWLATRELGNHEGCRSRLHRLVHAVHQNPVISHYEESSDSLDHVLNIFIRVNSGGTPLAFSDLLLSLATAEWSRLDARREVALLQDEMNSIGQGFSFGRDRILKAALVLADFENIKFRAENFGSRNMQLIEEQWPEIRTYLLRATELISGFGLSDRTLTAENAMIPIAYYLKARQAEESYLTSQKHRSDREQVRTWLFASLLRGGYWTGAVDPILLSFRESIRECGSDSFPANDFADRVRKRSAKSAEFAEEEVDELLELRYADRSSFLVLSLIFPGLDLAAGFHIDHLHPRKVFYARAMDKRGLHGEEAAAQKEQSEQLPNLQLLRGTPNQEKSGRPLVEWLDSLDAGQRQAIETDLLFSDLPTDLDQFDVFFEQRRQRMKQRLVELLVTTDD
jgi:hypothetical protein